MDWKNIPERVVRGFVIVGVIWAIAYCTAQEESQPVRVINELRISPLSPNQCLTNKEKN